MLLFLVVKKTLHFDQQYLEAPLPKHNIQTSSYCREQCQKLLDSLSQQGKVTESVRRILIESPGHFPSIEKVAQDLNYSVRTLRRYLSEEGNSYRQLVNEIRQQLAQDYLETRIPIEQIADMLGYAEPTNFSHAFKRWTSLSPQQYRKNILHGNSAVTH